LTIALRRRRNWRATIFQTLVVYKLVAADAFTKRKKGPGDFEASRFLASTSEVTGSVVEIGQQRVT
jgi:hypothetical protein